MGLVRDAIVGGYAVAGGFVGASEAGSGGGGGIDPGPLMAALRDGRTLGEAVLLGRRRIGDGLRIVGDPLARVPTPREGFEVVRLRGGEVGETLAVRPLAEPYEADVSGLVGEGESELGVVVRDRYGTASASRGVGVSRDGDGVRGRLRELVGVGARASAGGMVRVRFGVRPTQGGAVATGVEVAERRRRGVVLGSVSVRRPGEGAVVVGPFEHGETVRLVVRAVGSGGVVSIWRELDPVMVDAEGPVAPELVQ